MATSIGIGFSKHPDPTLAFKEAAITAKHQLNQPTSDLVLAFGSYGYPSDKNAAAPVQKLLQPRIFLYAMTGGIILPRSVEMRGIGILAIKSDELFFSSALRDQLNFFPLEESGIRLTREIAAGLDTPHRHALFYFLSGIRKNNSPLIRGMQEGLGRAFPIVGAVSADNFSGAHSMIGYQGTFFDDAVAGFLLGGQVPFALGTRQAWQPLGRPRIITSAEGNMIHTIDNRPASTIYEDYFREELAEMEPGKLGSIGLLYPLGISTDTPKSPLLRQGIEILSDGSIVCQGDIPAGAQVHLMIGDKDTCRQTAHSLAVEIKERLGGKPPRLILVLESIARRKLLGRSSWQEIAAIKEILGLTVPVFGMYTYGEIAPYGLQKNVQTIQVQSASIMVAAIG